MPIPGAAPHLDIAPAGTDNNEASLSSVTAQKASPPNWRQVGRNFHSAPGNSGLANGG